MRRLADRAVDETTDALRPFGYYEPNVRSRTTRDDENWIVRLKVALGEPVRLETVDIVLDGDGRNDRPLQTVISDSGLRQGARLDHPSYESLKAALSRTAQERGYLDAKLTRRELVVDPANRRADVHIALDTGARYHFGHVTIDQDAIEPRLLQRFVRFKEGDAFLAEQLRNTQFALEDSAYFWLGHGGHGRSRHHDEDGADHDHRRQDPPRPLQRQRRLRHRHRRARQGRPGTTGWSTSADIACRSSSPPRPC